MIRHALICVLASAAAFGLPSARAVAGSYSVSPIRVDLGAQAGTGVVTLRNQEDQPLVVQAEAHLWQQEEGVDTLAATRDLIVAPAVFTVPPKGAQVVRVALRREPDTGRELSYRLLLTEVPQPREAGATSLNFALQMSLPVFVAARQKTSPTLQWSAARQDDGALVVTTHNAGSEHARVLELEIAPVGATGLPVKPTGAAYVLPGQSRRWTIAAASSDETDKNSHAEWRTLRVKGTAEDGDFAAELQVAAD